MAEACGGKGYARGTRRLAVHRRGQIQDKALLIPTQKAPQPVKLALSVLSALPVKKVYARRNQPIKAAAAVTEWSAQELEEQRGLAGHALQREQARILHNRTAREKGVHVIAPYGEAKRGAQVPETIRCTQSVRGDGATGKAVKLTMRISRKTRSIDDSGR